MQGLVAAVSEVYSVEHVVAEAVVLVTSASPTRRAVGLRVRGSGEERRVPGSSYSGASVNLSEVFDK